MTQLDELKLIEQNVFEKKPYNILVICDTKFVNTANDIKTCREKFYQYYQKKNKHCNIKFYTCAGKYCFDKEIEQCDVDESKKTGFIKSLEYYINKMDEVLILSNYEEGEEKFIDILMDRLTEKYITFSVFRYDVKE